MKTKNSINLLLALILACLNISLVNAQNVSENFFGINYWLYLESGNNIYDNFDTHKTDLAAAKLGLIRIGGNYPNNSKYANNDKDWYADAVQKIKSIGCEPMVQLSIHLTSNQIVEWYQYLNDTLGLDIKYWCIGNEPDPGTNLQEWVNGTYKVDGNNYTEFKEKFRNNAKALKQVNSNNFIIGPDFRMFTAQAMDFYYEDFIEDIGTATTTNGDYILDTFAFHYYSYQNESELNTRFAKLKGILDQTNNSRASSEPLTFCVNEVNTTTHSYPRPWNFKAGQFISLMAKKVLAYEGLWITPWSIYESNGSQTNGGTDFSLYDNNANRRSTLWHLYLLKEYKRSNYMKGHLQDFSYFDIITQFGMKDAEGYTVMLMNTSESASYTYRGNLNNTYPSASAEVKLKFEGSIDSEFSGTIQPKSTILYKFSSDGTKLIKCTYGVNDNEPKIYILSDKYDNQYFSIQNAYTECYMRPKDGSSSEDIFQEENMDSTYDSFKWELESSSAYGGFYYIKNKYTGKVIRPKGASTSENAEIEQTDLSGKEDFLSVHWKVEETNTGTIRIYNKYSKMYLRPYLGMGGEVKLVQNTLNQRYSSFEWNLSTISSPTSYQKQDTENIWKVFPNPATNRMLLSKVDSKNIAPGVPSNTPRKKYYYSLFNLEGESVLTGAVKGKATVIDISDLNLGNYILKVYSKNEEEETHHILIKP